MVLCFRCQICWPLFIMCGGMIHMNKFVLCLFVCLSFWWRTASLLKTSLHSYFEYFFFLFFSFSLFSFIRKGFCSTYVRYLTVFPCIQCMARPVMNGWKCDVSFAKDVCDNFLATRMQRFTKGIYAYIVKFIFLRELMFCVHMGSSNVNIFIKYWFQSEELLRVQYT